MIKNITLTGPRSVGKTTISKLLAKRLRKKYISSDEIGEKATKALGGLDNAIKSGKMTSFIKKNGYPLIKKVYNKKNNYVFDLSCGSFAYRCEHTKEIRELASKKSFVIGLLPTTHIICSVLVLFKRESKRDHFRNVSKFSLFLKTLRNYINQSKTIKEHSNLIIYTLRKSPKDIVEEIYSKIN